MSCRVVMMRCNEDESSGEVGWRNWVRLWGDSCSNQTVRNYKVWEVTLVCKWQVYSVFSSLQVFSGRQCHTHWPSVWWNKAWLKSCSENDSMSAFHTFHQRYTFGLCFRVLSAATGKYTEMQMDLTDDAQGLQPYLHCFWRLSRCHFCFWTVLVNQWAGIGSEWCFLFNSKLKTK